MRLIAVDRLDRDANAAFAGVERDLARPLDRPLPFAVPLAPRPAASRAALSSPASRPGSALTSIASYPASARRATISRSGRAEKIHSHAAILTREAVQSRRARR